MIADKSDFPSNVRKYMWVLIQLCFRQSGKNDCCVSCIGLYRVNKNIPPWLLIGINRCTMTSSNRNICRFTAICVGNSPVTGEFPTQRRSFDVFFDLRLNRQLSKQSPGWWFETPSRLLWRHSHGLPKLKLWPQWVVSKLERNQIRSHATKLCHLF